MAFYRFDEDGAVYISETCVYFPDGTVITADCHEDVEYPHHGWEWFDSPEQAYTAHGLPVPPPT